MTFSKKSAECHLANTFAVYQALCWGFIGYPFPEYSETVLRDFLQLCLNLFFTWNNSLSNPYLILPQMYPFN